MATFKRREELAGRKILVRKAQTRLFKDLDIVFFAGGEGAKGASRQWAPIAIEAGAYCIDNSSDFRLDPNVPLVVPEVNMDVVTPSHMHIASPNCSTIQVVVAIAPLHRVARIKRLVISTYQSVSGAGGRAMNELTTQLRQMVRGQPVEFNPEVFPRPIALDCIPHIGPFLPNGYTGEEMKLVNETRKILDAPEMLITATTVRVPVMIGHAAAVNIEFKDRMTPQRAREILAEAPGVVLIDGPTRDANASLQRKDLQELQYPTQADILRDEYKDMVLVGRIRADETVDNGLNLWVVADNLRKGAATNVVQIAEKMIACGFFENRI
jgi:aspartate-semialdehyde dehydrogenase